MSYYRDIYLRSEDWQNLRAANIAVFSPEGRCFACRALGKRLDVHHLRYRKLYDARPWEMIPICRDCHDFAHQLLKACPDIKLLSVHQKMNALIQAVKKFPDKNIQLAAGFIRTRWAKRIEATKNSQKIS